MAPFSQSQAQKYLLRGKEERWEPQNWLHWSSIWLQLCGAWQSNAGQLMNYHFPVHYHSPLPYQMSTGNRPINAITSKKISQLQESWHQCAHCLTVFSPRTLSQWHLDKHSRIGLSTASQRRSHRTRPPSPPRRPAGRWTRPHRTPCCASPPARSARKEPHNCSARRSWCCELPSVVEGTWAQRLFEDSVACGASMSSWPPPPWRQLSGNRRRRRRWQRRQRGGDTTSWCRGLELVWEHQGLYRRQDTTRTPPDTKGWTLLLPTESMSCTNAIIRLYCS